MPPTKKTPSKSWQNSKEKALLMGDLRQGRIAVDGRGDARTILTSRPEFAEGTDDNQVKLFASRLRAARVRTKQLNASAAFDSEALRQDRLIFPVPAMTVRNEPRWEGSAAEALLKEDVKGNLHQTMKPQALYSSRLEYQEFSLSTFRGHIHQEVKLCKFIADKYNYRDKTK